MVYCSFTLKAYVFPPTMFPRLQLCDCFACAFLVLQGHCSFAAVADRARPPCLQDGVFVRGRALVVLLAPNKVPNSRDKEERSEDNGRVVHKLGSDRDGGWHGKEWNGQRRPGCPVLVVSPSSSMPKRLTQRNNVAESSQSSEVESAFLNLFSASDKRDENRNGVAQCETNDTNTRKGVESDRGAEVDQAKDKLNNHAEHHGVERNVQLDVDNLPPLEAGDGAIAGERPCGTGRGGGTTNSADQTENKERDQQADGGARASDCLLDDSGEGLTREQVEKFGLVGQDEHKRDQEDQSADGIECDGTDQRLGHLRSGVFDFFTHPRNESAHDQYSFALPSQDLSRGSWMLWGVKLHGSGALEIRLGKIVVALVREGLAHEMIIPVEEVA
jgi:hypothetical protein